jgi:prepilin-type N-terminal cleavage/methylation domain-containing protein
MVPTAKKVVKMKQQTSFLGSKSGYTLLELIVVIVIIGSMSLLIAPSFNFSEDSATKKFAPFRTFIENQRNMVIASGKPAVLELQELGKIKVVSLEKDEDNNPILLGELATDMFSFKTASGKRENGKILLMPNGTMEPLVIELPTVSAQLLYNGTSARGKVSVL